MKISGSIFSTLVSHRGKWSGIFNLLFSLPNRNEGNVIQEKGSLQTPESPAWQKRDSEFLTAKIAVEASGKAGHQI